ncbi:PREDICTED: E1A-binding protein p400-like [Propithecus coquereli]|uniref:E1A-binding protein p400-like n=1 Tax=Propithecus coquereli TaxID=379532 RepID=UPI00063F1A07|nr:PREDICTED: E1A-binding protein p400-like [Propithecus coquereli]
MMIQLFILRRSKQEVEKQLTKKYEHVLKCRVSNRQKALYEDVILQPRTQEALKSGQFVSVLHVLMKLQRICNHPDLVSPRLSGSSYVSEALEFRTASRILQALEHGAWKEASCRSCRPPASRACGPRAPSPCRACRSRSCSPALSETPQHSLRQESLEERRRLSKERLDRMFSGDERRCSTAPAYGQDLLGNCSFFGERKVPPHHFSGGFSACCRPWSPPPPSLYAANPPPSYSHKMRVFGHNLREELAPYLQQISAPHLLQFPDLRLVQYDSGKLEALAVLLQKPKSEGRINDYANYEQRQVSCSAGVSLVEADTVVFYDSDLNPVVDAKAQEWCDRIGRCKDVHVYRLQLLCVYICTEHST